MPLLVHDRNSHKLRALRRQYGGAIEQDFRRAIQRADVLLIAVRPASVSEVLAQAREIHPASHSKKSPMLACSLAAGIPLAKLRARLPVPWARAMPSPTARSGRGLTAVTFERGCSPAMRSLIKRLFAQVGPVCEIPEARFDAFMVTFSPSHGYHALAILAQAAEKLGLDRKTAFTAASHALADGIVAWREGEESLEHLLQEAATPGGIAATVMNSMNSDRYAQIVERALRSGLARARKNAKL